MYSLVRSNSKRNHNVIISDENIRQLQDKNMNTIAQLREQLFNLVDKVYGRAVIDIVLFNIPIADVPPIENIVEELEVPTDDLM